MMSRRFALTALLALAACSTNEPYATTASQPMPSATAVPAPTTSGSTATTATSGSSVMPAQGARLTASQIGSLLTGNTVTGIARNGQPYYAYFRPGGGVEFRQANYSDSGSWRISSDGRVCSTLTKLNAGTEECYSLYRNGTTIAYDRPDGNLVGTFTVEPGNPRSL